MKELYNYDGIKKITIDSFNECIEKLAPISITEHSIYNLESFLNGWLCSSSEKAYMTSYMCNLHKYIKSKFPEFSSVIHWSDILYLKSGDEFSAFELFYSLHNDFHERESRCQSFSDNNQPRFFDVISLCKSLNENFSSLIRSPRYDYLTDFLIGWKNGINTHDKNTIRNVSAFFDEIKNNIEEQYGKSIRNEYVDLFYHRKQHATAIKSLIKIMDDCIKK
ncbi:TPA: hypothetical protein ACVTEY_003201 [Salmonella enterica subsp. enterica]|nr:hypothetical protein [Salmonella enterica]